MAVDVEDLSDSGIEKAGDDESSTRTDVVPSSPRVPPEGADNDDIQIDQLRPHNHQFHQQNKTNGTNHNNSSTSITNVNFIDDSGRNQLSPSQDSSSVPMDMQRASQLEHHTSVPFCSNTYAAFKKGNVVRGILCPSLTNSFR